jgi:hypothetical protein
LIFFFLFSSRKKVKRRKNDELTSWRRMVIFPESTSVEKLIFPAQILVYLCCAFGSLDGVRPREIKRESGARLFCCYSGTVPAAVSSKGLLANTPATVLSSRDKMGRR